MTDMFGPDDPGNGPPDYWEDRWEATGEPSWWDDNITLWTTNADMDFIPLTYTAEDWFNETFNSDEENMELYGLSTLDIIHQLEDQGLWDRGGRDGDPSEDWEHWRENYEALAG